MREAEIAKEMRWCENYNGIPSGTCKAGVSYCDIHPEGYREIVCLTGDASRCASADFPNRERAIEKLNDVDTFVADFVRKINAQECSSCGKHYQGKQVGRCVYCEHCGARLYQGRKPKPREQALGDEQ